MTISSCVAGACWLGAARRRRQCCVCVCVCVRCGWHSLCLCQLLPQLLLAAQVLQPSVLHTGKQTVRAATAAADNRVAVTAAAASTVGVIEPLCLARHQKGLYTYVIHFSRTTHCGAHSGQLCALQQPVMAKKANPLGQRCCPWPGARRACDICTHLSTCSRTCSGISENETHSSCCCWSSSMVSGVCSSEGDLVRGWDGPVVCGKRKVTAFWSKVLTCPTVARDALKASFHGNPT